MWHHDFDGEGDKREEETLSSESVTIKIEKGNDNNSWPKGDNTNRQQLLTLRNARDKARNWQCKNRSQGFQVHCKWEEGSQGFGVHDKREEGNDAKVKNFLLIQQFHFKKFKKYSFITIPIKILYVTNYFIFVSIPLPLHTKNIPTIFFAPTCEFYIQNLHTDHSHQSNSTLHTENFVHNSALHMYKSACKC